MTHTDVDDMNNKSMRINWNAATTTTTAKYQNETMFSGMFTILNGYLIIALNNFAHKICHNISVHQLQHVWKE